jgi:hypothetical protein
MDNVLSLRKTFGNTITSTLWRYVEQAHAATPMVAMVSGHPHPRRRASDFDAANPCRYFVQSATFRGRFGAVTEIHVFDAIAGYCGAQRGGALGADEVILLDDNGVPHVYLFETFYNGHEALTLGVWLRPHALALTVGA